MLLENLELLSRITGWVTGTCILFYCWSAFLAVNRQHHLEKGKLTDDVDKTYRSALNTSGFGSLATTFFFIFSVAGKEGFLSCTLLPMLVSMAIVQEIDKLDKVGPALRIPRMILTAACIVILIAGLTITLPEMLRDLLAWLSSL